MNDLLADLARDPTRRRRRWVAGAIAAATAVAVTLGAVSHERALRAECLMGEARIASAWGPGEHVRLRAALVDTGRPGAADTADRVVATFDRYAAAWAETYRDASEATLVRKDQSAATLALRLQCLDDGREELAALVEVLTQGDDQDLDSASSAAYALSPPHACMDPGAARDTVRLPDAPAAGATVLAAKHAIAEGSALRAAGKLKPALAAATRMLEGVRAIGHRRTEAEMLLVVGEVHHDLDDDGAALGAWQGAFSAAEAGSSDGMAARAAARMAYILGDGLQRPADGRAWIAIARSILERIGPDDALEADILDGELAVIAGEGHPELGIPQHDHLIALLERLYGPQHMRVATAINDKATDLYSASRQDLAVVEFRRAIALEEKLTGTDNPTIATEYNNLGATLTELGRFDEAQAALDHALWLGNLLGEGHAGNVVTLASLAVLANRRGNALAALRAADRGLAIAETNANTSKYLASLLVERGIALATRGDAAASREACARAVAIQDALGAFDPTRTYAPDALRCLGEAEAALGRRADALAHLERSVSLTRRETASDLALAVAALARVRQ